MAPLAVATFASWVVRPNLGMIVAARMPITMTTTMISIRVNPLLLLFSVRTFISLFFQCLTHVEDGQQQRDDHEADQSPYHQDQGRREQGNHRFGACPH